MAIRPIQTDCLAGHTQLKNEQKRRAAQLRKKEKNRDEVQFRGLILMGFFLWKKIIRRKIFVKN